MTVPPGDLNGLGVSYNWYVHVDVDMIQQWCTIGQNTCTSLLHLELLIIIT